MARTKEEPKPLFPVKHEFYASLDRFVHEAEMLRSIVSQLVKNGAISPSVADIVKDRIEAFDNARSGEA